jgi:hypothetical protein
MRRPTGRSFRVPPTKKTSRRRASSRTNRFGYRPRPFRKELTGRRPHDGRDRVVVLLDKVNQVAETNEEKSSSSAWRVTFIAENSDVNVPNKSEQTKNLMILEFKDTVAEQALVRTEAPSPRTSQ